MVCVWGEVWCVCVERCMVCVCGGWVGVWVEMVYVCGDVGCVCVCGEGVCVCGG